MPFKVPFSLFFDAAIIRVRWSYFSHLKFLVGYFSSLSLPTPPLLYSEVLRLFLSEEYMHSPALWAAPRVVCLVVPEGPHDTTLVFFQAKGHSTYV